MEIFLITAKQMITLLCFVAIGFALIKLKILDQNATKVVSVIVTKIFIPMLCFNTMSNKMKVDSIAKSWPIILTSVLFLCVAFFLGKFFAKFFTKDRNENSIYTYGFAISNMAYIGYPVVNAVFGETGLFYIMLFDLPFSVFVFTIGMSMLTQQNKIRLKMLANPILIAIALGSVVGLVGLQMPEIVTNITTAGANCMSPCAMILMGLVLGKATLKDTLLKPKMYLVSAVRLIAMPIILGSIAYFVCWALNLDMLYACMTIIAASLPMGANSVAFVESAGFDGKVGAQSCFVSSLMALITLPIVFMLLQMLNLVSF